MRFLGRVSPDELRRYYQHAVALIVPSVCFETFGIILIEAFQQSTPVLARRIGPFPEIVEAAGGGELFTTGEELVAAMRRLQGDGEYRNRLAAAGHEAYLAHYCERAVVPQYLDIVRRTAEKKGDKAVLEKLATTDRPADGQRQIRMACRPSLISRSARLARSELLRGEVST